MDALRCSSSSVFRTTDPCLDSFPVLAEKSSLRASAPLSLTVNQSGAESTFQLEIFVLVTGIVTSAPSFDTVSDFPSIESPMSFCQTSTFEVISGSSLHAKVIVPCFSSPVPFAAERISLSDSAESTVSQDIPSSSMEYDQRLLQETPILNVPPFLFTTGLRRVRSI